MATKTYKLGEVCRGGVITVNTTKSKVTIIAKEWDFSQGTNKGSNQSNAKEFDRLVVDTSHAMALRKVKEYLEDLSTYYHSQEIVKWIESKTTFSSEYGGW